MTPGKRLLKAILYISIALAALTIPTLAATTAVTVTKYDSYGTVIDTVTVDINWMENISGLPVYGDGTTHYFFQGPTFKDSSFDLLWNPSEDDNVFSRDYGAVKGTDVRDLCDLVGGMGVNDYVTIKAEDPFRKSFDYNDVYTPDPEAMRMVLAWYNGEEGNESQGVGYPPDFHTGMRLFFFADTSINPWEFYCFGLWDMHENMAPNRWHYYYDGSFWPSSSGLSVKNVNRIEIYPPNLISCDAPGNPEDSFAPGETVYVKGLGLSASTDYKLWVQGEPVLFSPLNALDRPSGTAYTFSTGNDPSGTQETVTTDSTGDFGPTAIWTIDASATQQKYDIVADSQTAGTVGTYDVNDFIDAPGLQGISIVPRTFTKSLVAGWNLISLPLVADDMTVANVIDPSLSGSYDALFSYDAGTHAFVELASPGDEMENGVGYFIHLTSADTWRYGGEAFASLNTGLLSGLNCIGWLNCSKDVNDGLSSIAGNYYYVARWDAATQEFETYNPTAPGVFNDFSELARGEGYFISMKTGDTVAEVCT